MTRRDEDHVRYSGLVERGAWILAFDTSGPEGSVALGRSGDIVATGALGLPREHATKLMDTANRLLEQEGVSVRDIGGIVVGAGPGSFTGVRVAAATAKGLWHGLRIPVWPVSSLLAAVCDPAAEWGTEVRAALFDARGERVYGAAYRVTAASIHVLVPPFAEDLDVAQARIAAACGPETATFSGSGAWRHRERIETAGFHVRMSPVGRPTAAGLLDALRLDPATEAHDNPAQWEPAYLRASSAERSRQEAGMFDSGP